MTWHHKPSQQDVQEAFTRFAALCPGHTPRLDVENGQPTYYTIEDSDTLLDGHTILGHSNALLVLLTYCAGWGYGSTATEETYRIVAN